MKRLPAIIVISIVSLFSVFVVSGFLYFKFSKVSKTSLYHWESAMNTHAISASYGTHKAGHAWFSDFTQRSGINFFHSQTEEVIDSIPQVMGSGVCLLDYDGDGNTDVYMVNGSGYTYYYGRNPWWYKSPANALYRNRGDGTFTDITKSAGVGFSGWGMGCSVGDFNNDGHPDLYVTNYGENVLYQNNGDGTFKDVTKKAGVGGKKEKWSTSSAWADYDNDGKLDLYVLNYMKFDKMMNPAEPGSSFHNAGNLFMNSKIYTSAPNILYHNNGDGTFTEVTKKAGIEDSAGKGLGVVFSDFDNDGKPDIYIVNDGARNVLFHNNGDGTFTDIGGESGVDTPLSAMGVAVGDFDNDGAFDIFSTYPASETNILYRNLLPDKKVTKVKSAKSSRSFMMIPFKDVTVEAGLGEEVGIGYFGWGTDLFDYDNDGYLDIFVANGSPSPDFDNPRSTVGQKNQLFHNNGDGKFTDVSESAGDGLKVVKSSRGAAFGDIDNDGDMDIIINNNNDYATVLRNEGGNSGNFLTIRLTGTKSNRDGVGTKVTVFAGSLMIMKEVRSGSSYLSQNDIRLHFGLSKQEKADRVIIQWPSGVTQTFKDIQAGQFISITEGKDEIKINKRVRPGVTMASAKAKYSNALSPENILQALSDKDTSKRIAAMEALRNEVNEELIDKSVEPVVMSLESPDKNLRKEAVSLLCKFLKDEQTIFRTTMYRKRLAVVPLLKSLGDPEPEVRMGVVKALGYSESYRAIIPVSEMLKDPDNGVRREAALALGWLKDKRGIEPLIDTLKDINEDPSVRSGALLSLFRLESGVTTAPVIEQMRSGEERNRIRAMEVLQASLRDEESVLLNRKGLVQPLMELLQDQDKEIRRAAIKTLCLIKDTAITPVIIGTLSDKSDDVRKEAAAGLGELRDKRATNPLAGLLKDKDDEIRNAAIKSLGLLLDKAAVPSIYQIVNDKNEKKTIRLFALAALQDIDLYYWDRNAYLFLEDLIPEIRHEAVKGVGKAHSTQSVDLLIKCLQNDKDRGVRREVVAALGLYKEKRVVDLLIGIIKSSSEAKDIRTEAIISLTHIGDDRAVIHLYGIAQNKRDELRAEAADAIERFGK